MASPTEDTSNIRETSCSNPPIPAALAKGQLLHWSAPRDALHLEEWNNSQEQMLTCDQSPLNVFHL